MKQSEYEKYFAEHSFLCAKLSAAFDTRLIPRHLYHGFHRLMQVNVANSNRNRYTFYRNRTNSTERTNGEAIRCTYASTGQGNFGHIMFACCRNNSICRIDALAFSGGNSIVMGWNVYICWQNNHFLGWVSIMKNKQHEFILKAFVESAIPESIRFISPDLIMIDSVLGGYATQLLQGADQIIPIKFPVITREDKNKFSTLIGGSTGKEKELLIIYYRLAILTETIILQYL